MARIRTVKPEFFRHEGLQDLERANPGKHSMLVFAGLWGHCDRDGKFEWKPRMLKLDILPFLEFDMAETLEVLRDAGQVRKYSVAGKDFGFIPTFKDHQRITGKELEHGGKFPSAPDVSPVFPGEAPEKHPDAQEGKGKEGKGLTGGLSPPTEYSADFERAWEALPKREGDNPKKPAFACWKARLGAGRTAEEMIAGSQRYGKFCRDKGKVGTEFVMQAKRFFGPTEPFLQAWSVGSSAGDGIGTFSASELAP